MGREDISSVKKINIQLMKATKTLLKFFKVQHVDLTVFINLANVSHF